MEAKKPGTVRGNPAGHCSLSETTAVYNGPSAMHREMMPTQYAQTWGVAACREEGKYVLHSEMVAVALEEAT